jgi:cyclopropane fatty-acyl-phospholipid synthase-like methyltransferase
LEKLLKTEIYKFIEQYARETGVLSAVHPDDYIFRFLLENESFANHKDAVRYYFYDGKNSAQIIEKILFKKLGLDKDKTSILEFASGYGCITRHLVKIISQKQIVCCDIHSEAIEFLSTIFGVQTLSSTIKPQDFSSKYLFDVVFALSFFSHVPPQRWGDWLESLFAIVKPNGYLIFTTQGLESRKYHHNPLIPDSGIWFTPDSEQKDLDVQEYGQTIVTIDYVVNQVFSRLGTFFKMIRPGYWWEHQDLYIIQKTIKL